MDRIIEKDDGVHHESAGGFLFYDDPKEGLMVALVKKVEGTYWMPKGHLEEGETPEEAAKRELTEELSLEQPPELFSKVRTISYSFLMPGDDRKHFKDVHVFIFKTENKKKIGNLKMQFIPGEKDRFENPEWLTVEEALQKIEFDRDTLNESINQYLESRDRVKPA